MMDLALSILCSSLIFVIFRFFSTYNINTLLAIIVNYVVACICGLVYDLKTIDFSGLAKKPWMLGALALGFLFISIFSIMARSSQRNGVGVTAVATKMSLVIPVIFSVALYNETLSLLQLIGILLALVAVYFASTKETGIKITFEAMGLPFLVFLGSGIIDTSIKYFQERLLSDYEYPIFSSAVFGSAAVLGLLLFMAQQNRDPKPIGIRSFLGGIFLGIPNYFSIFFLLRALGNNSFSSASVFTINNVAIVLFSTLLGVFLFHERLHTKNGWGILFAVISIVLVALF